MNHHTFHSGPPPEYCYWLNWAWLNNLERFGCIANDHPFGHFQLLMMLHFSRPASSCPHLLINLNLPVQYFTCCHSTHSSRRLHLSVSPALLLQILSRRLMLTSSSTYVQRCLRGIYVQRDVPNPYYSTWMNGVSKWLGLEYSSNPVIKVQSSKTSN